MRNLMLLLSFLCIANGIEAKKKDYPDAYLVCYHKGEKDFEIEVDKVRTIEEVSKLRDTYFPELQVNFEEILKKELYFEAGTPSNYFYVEVKSLVRIDKDGDLILRRKKK